MLTRPQLRPTTVKAIRTVDNWVVFNAVAMVAAIAPIVWFFGWWPVAQKTLGKKSRASFTLRGSRRVAARVLLTLPDGATPLATSKTLRVHASG